MIAKALCESPIESVNLSGNKITEKYIDAVVGTLKTNKNLRNLDLQNNAIASRVVKNKLKNALPSMEVLVWNCEALTVNISEYLLIIND